jgi:hypothetical protein
VLLRHNEVLTVIASTVRAGHLNSTFFEQFVEFFRRDRRINGALNGMRLRYRAGSIIVRRGVAHLPTGRRAPSDYRVPISSGFGLVLSGDCYVLETTDELLPTGEVIGLFEAADFFMPVRPPPKTSFTICAGNAIRSMDFSTSGVDRAANYRINQDTELLLLCGQWLTTMASPVRGKPSLEATRLRLIENLYATAWRRNEIRVRS